MPSQADRQVSFSGPYPHGLTGGPAPACIPEDASRGQLGQLSTPGRPRAMVEARLGPWTPKVMDEFSSAENNVIRINHKPEIFFYLTH